MRQFLPVTAAVYSTIHLNIRFPSLAIHHRAGGHRQHPSPSASHYVLMLQNASRFSLAWSGVVGPALQPTRLRVTSLLLSDLPANRPGSRVVHSLRADFGLDYLHRVIIV
mgnify:CR=1 FL=1